ncbi:MAG: hypothetical protein IJV27_06720 [Prevotella sp.]|nr:hypothetical protein [Prevotella sp.]
MERDARIFRAVAERLRADGYEVVTVSEDELREPPSCDVLFSMARGTDALHLLADAEERGIRVCNSPAGVLKYSRSELVRAMEELDIPAPASVVIPLQGEEEFSPFQAEASRSMFLRALSRRAESFSFPLWAKRGDACAQQDGDVRRIASAQELLPALEGFVQGGVAEVVLTAHADGDLLKFYGVEGTPFFYTCYPTLGGYSKFGLERFNGEPAGHAFSHAALKRDADRLARHTGFAVYGGDCVVAADGTYRIIDFNDWPSFSPCTEEAAAAIANRITA